VPARGVQSSRPVFGIECEQTLSCVRVLRSRRSQPSTEPEDEFSSTQWRKIVPSRLREANSPEAPPRRLRRSCGRDNACDDGADGEDEFVCDGRRGAHTPAPSRCCEPNRPVFQVARQRSVPVVPVETATDSRMPLRLFGPSITTSSPAIDGAPQPADGARATPMGGPFVGQAQQAVSREVPSPRGPWNCAQSRRRRRVRAERKALRMEEHISCMHPCKKTPLVCVNHACPFASGFRSSEHRFR